MVAALVPLEFLGGLCDFGRHYDGRGLDIDQIVVAWLGLQSLRVRCEFGGGEDLKLLCWSGCGSLGEERWSGENETGGDRRGAKEVPARRILDHGESQTQIRGFCQLLRRVDVH